MKRLDLIIVVQDRGTLVGVSGWVPLLEKQQRGWPDDVKGGTRSLVDCGAVVDGAGA